METVQAGPDPMWQRYVIPCSHYDYVSISHFYQLIYMTN